MKVFFDTEFSSLTERPLLISIGFITECGTNNFYAELSDTYCSSDLSQFSLEHVIPLLECKKITLKQLSNDLSQWLSEINDEIELASDNAAWDWRLLLEILDKNWPNNVSLECYLLNLNYLYDADAYYDAVQNAYDNGLRKHHALDDAVAIRLGWLASEGKK